jgi:hypothetical protein
VGRGAFERVENTDKTIAPSTAVLDAETQACSERCTYLAIGGHVAALAIEAEAEAMALEEELSRSTPPAGVAALAADGDLEAAT